MKTKFSFVIIICFCIVKAVGQKLSIDSAVSNLAINYPQEKVFLQSDKAIYTWGETIWMKAWCILDNRPTYLSKILYVDLVNDSGRVVLKKMYKLDSLSSTPADFTLGENIPSGNYHLDAYSLWMLNFPQFIATKNIYIYGTDYLSKGKKSLPPSVKMYFFPEGGNFIQGISNKVAFKLLDQHGFPLNLEGEIKDELGRTILQFHSAHDGLGVFDLVPEDSHRYEADIKFGNGAVYTFPLPECQREGVSMTVNNINPNRVAVLLNRGTFNQSHFSTLKLVGQINNNIVFAKYLNLDEGEMAASINKRNMPPGILQITVFDSGNVPLCERLAFVANYTIVRPALSAVVVNSRPRSVNRFDIADLDKSASFSVKVTDASIAQDSSVCEDNIISDILLTSDIKGPVFNPGYYFKDKEAKTLSDLDLLLMTQGWRRFKWQQILAGNYPALKYPVESTMSIGGSVTKSDRNAVVKNGFVSFIVKTRDSATIIGQAQLTDKGEFLFNDLDFRQNAKISYMGTDSKKNKYIVDVKFNPSHLDTLQKAPVLQQLNLDTIDISNSKSAFALMLSGKYQDAGNALKEVTVQSRRKQLSPVDSLNNLYTEGPFRMGKGINPADYKNYRTIWQIIQAAVPGVSVSGNPIDPDVSFNRFQGLNAFSQNSSTTSLAGSSDGSISVQQSSVSENGGIAYFLNGVNVDKAFINTLTVEDVAYIKVMKTEASVLGATQGAIAIYTKGGAVSSLTPYDKTYQSFEKEGYALIKEYYAPTPFLNNNDDKDSRSLLYWKAKPLLSNDGNYHFTFYNNDVAKKFKVLIQGIDRKGNLIYLERLLD